MQLVERRFSKSFGVRAVAYNNGVGRMGKVQVPRVLGRKIKNNFIVTVKIRTSAGLTMWQMWQMPRASCLRGPPEVEKFFSPRH